MQHRPVLLLCKCQEHAQHAQRAHSAAHLGAELAGVRDGALQDLDPLPAQPPQLGVQGRLVGDLEAIHCLLGPGVEGIPRVQPHRLPRLAELRQPAGEAGAACAHGCAGAGAGSMLSYSTLSRTINPFHSSQSFSPQPFPHIALHGTMQVVRPLSKVLGRARYSGQPIVPALPVARKRQRSHRVSPTMVLH